MTRLNILVGAVSFFLLAGAQPALSEESEEKQSRVRTICSRMTSAPKAVAGVMCGVTVGVPVKIARSVAHESLRMRTTLTDDFGGDKPDMTARLMGSYIAIPYGVVSGFIKGTIQGTERGVECGFRKPFSRESMSLSDPD